MDIFLIGIISYLMGSIPFGLVLTKIFLKKDIREIGSGNIGATNALRTGIKAIGYSTLVLDILKAVAPVIYVKIFYQDFLYIASLCAFLGHVFPIWLKFKGGKGVATYIGFLFGLNPYIALLFLLVWLVTAFVSKYSSLGSLIAILVAPAYYIFINFNFYILIFFIYLTLIIYLKHTENIKRLINKTESKIKLSK